MSDSPPESPDEPGSRWIYSLDLRDLLGVAGVAVMLAGAAAVHWGLAVAAVGAGLFGLACRLSR